MTNEEKSRVLSVKASCEAYFNKEAQKQYLNQSTETIARINAYGACMEIAKWKDEQHEQSLIDLNCKLEEQQENYDELKRRYDESVEREIIATKIMEQKRLDFLELEAKACVWKSLLRDAQNEIKLLKHRIEELCKR